MRNRTFIGFWLLLAAVHAQTQIDLRTQSKTVDFSAAASTQPAKKGTTLPSACVAGEQFFKTDAAAGQNLFLCASANTWTQSGQIPATVALTNQSNAYTGGTQDFSGRGAHAAGVEGDEAAKPATCTTCEQYFATDAAAGQNLFYCAAARLTRTIGFWNVFVIRDVADTSVVVTTAPVTTDNGAGHWVTTFKYNSNLCTVTVTLPKYGVAQSGVDGITAAGTCPSGGTI